MSQKFKFTPMQHVKGAWSMVDEFKSFAFKGNVIDLAIGVVIGGAFGKVVDSLVKSLIIPLISLLFPTTHGYAEWKWVFNGHEIPYGLFIGEVMNFIIVSLAIFLFLVKFLGLLMRSKKQEASAPPPPTKEEILLTEIRDLLKAQK